MRSRLTASVLAIFVLLVFTFSGCGSQAAQKATNESKQVTVTDMAGRRVSLNIPAKRVVAIGPGALRLYCYINGANKVVGVEQMEKSSSTGRPYLIANPSLTSLPIIGPGGPNTLPDPEKILSVKPDVIFDTLTTDKAAIDELQAKTRVPVVALSYGKVSVFDPGVYSSLKLIGKIMGMDKRAKDVVAYMEQCQQDLDQRTRDIPDSRKPSTYVGALGMKGTHGIESTQGNYSLFQAIHAKNVVDETGTTGSLMIDKEKLIQWNPDKIFIDEGGLSMVQQDYKKNRDYYRTLSAVNNGELYAQMPYNYYTTNIDTAMADAYYLGKVLYPDKFKDIDPIKKADQIYEFLLGKPVYDQMARDFGGFKKLTLE